MSKKYVAHHCHSWFSLLDGMADPKEFNKRLDELEMDACAITDHGSLSGSIQFYQAMKKGGKKPILGCELYVCANDPTIKTEENKKLAHLVVLAKNDRGWLDLMKMVSLSNKYEQFYYKPRLSFDQIKNFAQNGNLICFSGHLGSQISNAILLDRTALNPNWREDGAKLAHEFRDVFGPNFFLEVQLMDQMHNPTQKIVAECVRQISKDTGIPCVATPDSHYLRQDDAADQRVLLCSNMNMTMQQAMSGGVMKGFFSSAQYHIPSYNEMKEWHTGEELDNTLLIASQIEEYTNITKPPILPKVDCPDGLTSSEYLKQICQNELVRRNLHNNQQYIDRFNKEMSVIEGAGLSSYFLIVSDMLKFIKDQGWLAGIARGSSGGSLVSYLSGIIEIDPIPPKLLFERFYNDARKGSLPDIDIDVPKYGREKLIQYITKKYGEERVGQIATYHTLKGKSALKAVLRAHGGITFEEMNEITENFIEEGKISDELNEMREAGEEPSIIMWCLENTPKKLQKWAFLDGDEIKGPLASRFIQAIRLEGVKTTLSKHASGVVIAPAPLYNMFPMVLDQSSKSPMIAFEMKDVEPAGGVKFDILGLVFLDKMMGIRQDLATGVIHEI